MDGLLRPRGVVRVGVLLVGVVRVLAIALALAGVLASPAAAKPKATPSVEAPVSPNWLFLDMPLTHVEPGPIDIGTPAGAPFFAIAAAFAGNDGRKDAPRLTSAVRGDFGSDAPVAWSALPPPSDEPFGLFAFRAPEGGLWAKWRRLEAELSGDLDALARCRADAEACSAAAVRFLKIVDTAQANEGRARIASVNRSVNDAVRYVSDYEQHGVADRWSAPLATFASGQGDCEDYAIAKFLALREAGFAAQDLRLLLVRDLVSRQDHAVLAARQDGRWLVLDNRWSALIEPADLTRFMPLFAIDDQGVKLFATPYAAQPPHERETAPAGDQAGLSGAGSLPLVM